MFLLLGRPLAAITSGLTNWLSGMSGTSVIILGIILGLMMCFDLGGPVNKAAYAFAVAGLNVADPASLRIMAAVMAAGMVPPLAMALATSVRPGAVHRAGAGERTAPPWLLGAVVHLRRCHPVRGRRPAAGDSVDDGRRRGHRRADHGVRRHAEGPARRHLRVLRDQPHRCGSWSRWPPAPSSPRWP